MATRHKKGVPSAENGASSPISPRVKRREQRRERSREEIVEAARVVVLRDGLSKATLATVAREVGLTKAAIYYYYPSKDALFFELVFSILEAKCQAVNRGVQEAKDGPESLAAIIRETVHLFAPRMDDFRLAFLHAQIAGQEAWLASSDQLTRIRPLNDLAFSETAERLRAEQDKRKACSRVDPRLMAFLADVAALGLLTMKGMVESAGDPLRYSDEELIDGLGKIFAAAANA